MDNSNIYLGSYPLHEVDVRRLYEAGVTAVLNLQTPEDFRQRAVDQSRLLAIYKSLGINQVINCPLNDIDEEEYVERLMQASKYLNEMINMRK